VCIYLFIMVTMISRILFDKTHRNGESCWVEHSPNMIQRLAIQGVGRGGNMHGLACFHWSKKSL